MQHKPGINDMLVTIKYKSWRYNYVCTVKKNLYSDMQIWFHDIEICKWSWKLSVIDNIMYTNLHILCISHHAQIGKRKSHEMPY